MHDASLIEPICDGSSALRLRVFVEPQLAREMRGSAVRVENGLYSFAVDGSCQYLVSGSWRDDITSLDQGWRVGQVDDALRAELDRSMGTADLSSLSDCISMGGQFDFSAQTIRNQRSKAHCLGTPGPRFSAAWAVVFDRGADLWARGKPLPGGIRVEVIDVWGEAPGGPVSQAYPWPAGLSLEAYIVDPMLAALNPPGLSKLIPAGEAQQFRSLRDQFIADVLASPNPLGSYGNGQKMTDGQRTALVYMRDELPYEDANGLLPFSDVQ
jgi:hypothetical protein